MALKGRNDIRGAAASYFPTPDELCRTRPPVRPPYTATQSPAGGGKAPDNVARPLANAPKGNILLILRQFDKSSWRVQLAAVPIGNGGEEVRFNVRHWDERGYPMAGVTNGFPLQIREARKLVEALKEGIRMVESGEIGPDIAQNANDAATTAPVRTPKTKSRRKD